MERVAVDIMGPYPRTDKGNHYVLAAMDYFTKWPEAYAIPDQEAETVANALVEGMFTRFNRTLAKQLAILTAEHQRDWDMHLPLVLMAYRSAAQDSTSCTAALLMLGRELRTPAEMAFGRPPDTPGVPPGPQYARRLQDRMESVHAFARDQLQKAGVRQEETMT
ncbi:hypothetical protein L3Q82_012872 [Scortum barcoo]|uniref:Uncharacterized protein n=1 Tax=Scortum barcoo TaxID=214431 RepID=A0ACB8VZ70_9TELE|nr:hypothetical protein L3Q82_012872 [Scortum barcoo]